MGRAEKRLHMTHVLRTLTKAQKHADRIGVVDQQPVDKAKKEAVAAVVDAFIMDLPEADERAVQSTLKFLRELGAEAEKRYSVVEKAWSEEIIAMTRAMEAATDAATEARFANDKVLDEAAEAKAQVFYNALGKHLEHATQYHGAEFILMIAKSDRDFLSKL